MTPDLFSSEGNLHEASASSNHDILDIRQRLEFGAALENGGLLPHAIILKEAGSSPRAVVTIAVYGWAAFCLVHAS